MPSPLLYNAPLVETYTTWFNPLSQDQYVDIFHGDERRPTRYICEAGQEVKIPSRYDAAIQRVENSVIIGGLAPQLVKRGSTAKLDPALDTTARDRDQAEAEGKLAAMRKSEAEDAMILAEAKKRRADEEKAEQAKRDEQSKKKG